MVNVDFKDIEIMPLGTSSSGGGGSSGDEGLFEQLGYATPKYIQDGVDYAKQIKDNWDASVTNRSNTFSGDTQLMFFPLVDTSNVTNMNSMFSTCTKLQYVPPLITSKVTYVNNMFNNCRSLTSLDLSSFDTSNVTNMNYMFSQCYNLTSIEFSNSFNTSNVTSMSGMFSYCSGLTLLDLSSFDTSKVTYMSQMFYQCYSLTSLDLSSFDTSNVTDMSFMFNGCNFSSLDLSSFDTSKVTNMMYMFGGCNNLERVDGYISLAKLTSVPNSVINTKAIRKITFKDLGYNSNCTMALFNNATNWGVNSDTITDARQSLIDSLITYSFDRATNGYSTCTVSLHTNTKAQLTEDEIAAMTAKGFTIA